MPMCIIASFLLLPLCAATLEEERMSLEQLLKQDLKLSIDPFSQGLQQIDEPKLMERILTHFKTKCPEKQWDKVKIKRFFQHPLLGCSNLLKQHAAKSFAERSEIYKKGISLRIEAFNRLIKCLSEKTHLLQPIIEYLNTFNITEENEKILLQNSELPLCCETELGFYSLPTSIALQIIGKKLTGEDLPGGLGSHGSRPFGNFYFKRLSCGLREAERPDREFICSAFYDALGIPSCYIARTFFLHIKGITIPDPLSPLPEVSEIEHLSATMDGSLAPSAPDNWWIQVSKTAGSENLETKVKKEIAFRPTLENFSWQFIATVLLNMEDKKPANYVVNLDDPSKPYLVSIDNEDCLGPPVIIDKDKKRRIGIKDCLLLWNDYMLENVENLVRKKLLELSLMDFLYHWLLEMESRNKKLEEWRSLQPELQKMNLPICLSNEHMVRIVTQLRKIQEVLEKDNVTHHPLFHELYPAIAEKYAILRGSIKNPTLESLKNIELPKGEEKTDENSKESIWVSMAVYSVSGKQLSQAILSLKKLDLSKLGIKPETMKVLESTSGKMSSLESLDLSYNNIDEEGLKTLTRALVNTSSLTSLNLSYNNIVNGNRVKILVPAFKKMLKLISLDLTENSFDSSIIQELEECGVLSQLKQFKYNMQVPVPVSVPIANKYLISSAQRPTVLPLSDIVPSSAVISQNCTPGIDQSMRGGLTTLPNTLERQNGASEVVEGERDSDSDHSLPTNGAILENRSTSLTSTFDKVEVNSKVTEYNSVA